jgi:CRP/FNR family transcriptional regulator, dissimilatory nitrate respiration regulator
MLPTGRFIMYQEWINVLNSCRLFGNIDNESLGIMLNCLKPKISRYKQREIIVAYGQPFHGIGIIADGKVALTKETYSGNRIVMGILDAGEIFGETAAFSGNRLWPVTVIDLEDSVVLFLPPDKLTGTCSNVCASHSTLIMNMLAILSARASMLDKQIEHISAKNIRGKISSYLLDIYNRQKTGTINLPMKRHEMADYLNIPRPSLSREMALMRDDGIIEFDGPVVNIKNISALEESVR